MKTNNNDFQSIKVLIQKELERLIRSNNIHNKEYLTRQEAAELLRVDLSTIHNWTKRNILTSYGIGGRVYYKKEEIDRAFIKLNNKA